MIGFMVAFDFEDMRLEDIQKDWSVDVKHGDNNIVLAEPSHYETMR
jgi:hypothetical protein